MTEEKSPSEQAFDLQASWNPPPEDKGFERVVGVPTEEGDTRATAHTPMEELNAGFSDAVNATDDGDDDDELDALNKEGLQDEAESRGLSTSGTKQELKDRIREYDAAGEDKEE